MYILQRTRSAAQSRYKRSEGDTHCRQAADRTSRKVTEHAAAHNATSTTPPHKQAATVMQLWQRPVHNLCISNPCYRRPAHVPASQRRAVAKTILPGFCHISAAFLPRFCRRRLLPPLTGTRAFQPPLSQAALSVCSDAGVRPASCAMPVCLHSLRLRSAGFRPAISLRLRGVHMRFGPSAYRPRW